MTRTASRTPKLDQVCADAVDIARDGVIEEPGHIGEHLRALPEGDRMVTHYFACDLPGYRGWQWAVTVTRAPRSKHVTVCETVLLPGSDALLAPGWVPWHERLHPGDLGVGDLLPTHADDDRLTPGYMLSGDVAIDDIPWELGLGRPRVMSPLGRADAAQRWYDGDNGPEAPISTAAPRNARCVSCGFYLTLTGSLGRVFGVCGNVYAPDDGRIVSLDHGCGGHSEILIEETALPAPPTVYDDSEVEEVERPAALAPAAAAFTEPEAAAEPEAVEEPEIVEDQTLAEPAIVESEPVVAADEVAPSELPKPLAEPAVVETIAKPVVAPDVDAIMNAEPVVAAPEAVEPEATEAKATDDESPAQAADTFQRPSDAV